MNNTNNNKYQVLGLSVGCLGVILIMLLQLAFLGFAIFCGFQAYDAFFVSDAIAAGIA